MTLTVASEIIDFSTSQQVWKALEDLYGSTNKARKQQLKAVLQNTRKGSMKMSDYLSLLKQVAHNLALARTPVGTDDLTSYVVSGLGAKYLPITYQINKDKLTWQEWSSTLITFENTLISLNVINNNTEVGNITANVAYNRQNANSNQSNFKSTNQGRG